MKKTKPNIKVCSTCQMPVLENTGNCPHCQLQGHPSIKIQRRIVHDYSKLCGLSGSLLLAIGVFCPVISAPFVGDINMFQYGESDGFGILILALLSVGFILTNETKKLWYSAIGTLIMIAVTFYQFKSKLGPVLAAMDTVAATPFHGLTDGAMQTVTMQWGWGVLIIGCCLILATACYRSKKGQSKPLSHPKSADNR
jgi:hypothetical protein